MGACTSNACESVGTGEINDGVELAETGNGFSTGNKPKLLEKKKLQMFYSWKIELNYRNSKIQCYFNAITNQMLKNSFL